MWPWGHLAVGYLLYTTGVRLSRTGHERLALVALAIGTQLPDLVDKPLTWVGVLPYGRSLTHSLVVLVPVCLLALLVARRLEWGHAGTAFGLGALSHVVVDGWDGLTALDPDRVGFLLWPLTPLPESTGPGTPTGHATELAREVDATAAGPGGPLDVTLSDPVFQGVVCLAVAALWVAEGTPGWDREGSGHTREASQSKRGR